MIDLKDLRERPDVYRANMRKKARDDKLLNHALAMDEKWRGFKIKADSLRAERNKVSEAINQAKKKGKDARELIKKAREIPEKLKKLEEEESRTYIELQRALYDIPNLMHSDVPIGKSEKDNVVRKIVGPTEPLKASPGTIRGDYAHHSFAYSDSVGIAVKNLIHASGNIEEAKKEIKLWFKDKELHTYKTVHEKHVF